MPIYKIIFAFIIFCFFQTNQSISDETTVLNKSFLTEDVKDISSCQNTYYLYDDFTGRITSYCKESKKTFASGIFKWEFKDKSLSDKSQTVEIRLIEEDKSGKITPWNDILRLNFKNNSAEYLIIDRETQFFKIIKIEDINKESAEQNIAKKSSNMGVKFAYDQDCTAVEEFLTKEPDAKINNLGGYKHIHFGMLKIDLYKILDCKSSLKIFDWDEYYGMGNNRDRDGKQGITVEGLYKYKVGIIFKDDVIDAVRLIMFTTPKIKRQFYQIGETGIEKFEQFKKALSSKYKLQTKPTKISKDEYNNKSTLSILTWVFKNNGNDNLILLKLFQIPAGDQVRYSYSGEIHYLSEEQSKSYTKEIDGTKVKSDDL